MAKYTCLKKFKTATCYAYPVADTTTYGVLKLGSGFTIEPDGSVSATPSSATVTWDDVENKPTEFNPSAHTHPTSSITGLDSALNDLDSRLTSAQRIAINALVSPTVDYADLTEATAAIKSIIDALKAV